MFYAKFTPEGIPAHIVEAPQDGYEALPEDMTLMEAASKRRRANGTWTARPAPPKPTAAEVEAARLAQQGRRREERQEQRRMERDAARRERLFDKMVAAIAMVNPGFAADVAALEAEFPDDEGAV